MVENTIDNKILALWQPQGFSTHIISKKVAEKFDVKTSHTGTLDPMAEGIIIVLLENERLKKYEYAKWLKTYEFEMILGIHTDSYDGLGITDRILNFETQKYIEPSTIENVISTFEGEYAQEVPPFSAIKVKGKPMHWWARNGNLDQITVPTRTGEIKNIHMKATSKKTLEEISTQVINKIKKVTGDLRQKEIIARWEMLLKEYNNKPEHSIEFQCIKVEVTTTKGIYIRQLSQDIAEKLGTFGFVSDLIRVRNGAYSKRNCLFMEDIFGPNYIEKYDFESKTQQ